MAKKKSHDNHEVTFTESALDQGLDSEHQPVVETSSGNIETAHPLMEEVQSFLNLRDELARKLAIEIEALEAKLAELKKTAASLFPGNDSDATTDRKAKKPKPKATSQKERSDHAGSSEQKMITTDP